MEENFEQQQEEQVQQSVTGSKLFPILGGVVVLLLVVGGAYWYLQTQKTDVLVTDVQTTTDSNNTGTEWNNLDFESQQMYRPMNFGLKILSDWEPIEREKVTLPQDFGKAHFAYAKKNTSCVFAYAEVASSTAYRQTSFAERVFTSENNQIDGSWYIHNSEVPDGFAFDWNGRQPFRNEIRRNYYYPSDMIYLPVGDSSNAMVLYSSSGDIVDDECDADMSTMLRSIFYDVGETEITESSNGIAYFGQYKNKSSLFFASNDDSISKFVLNGNFSYSPPPLVYMGELYLVVDGQLQILDMISGATTKVLDISHGGASVINDFYITSDKIFYLYGMDCNSYMDKCNLDLYVFDRTTNQSEKLAKGLIYRNIVGYDENKDEISVKYSTGDAGCFSTRHGIYNLSSGEPIKEDKIGGCVGDTPPDPAYEEYLASIEIFTNKTVSFMHILIENGKIVIPKKEINARGMTIEFAK
jgi:hypothetical protein